MREKLEKIIDAYEELEQKLGDPQILADQHEYNKLAKSYADQGPLVVAARKYVQDLNDLAEAKEMLSDADMKEFAQEEISRIEGELPQLEEDIKFMLIPSALPTIIAGKWRLWMSLLPKQAATRRSSSR